MTTKIIDNLQITITGVHIRYEDSISSPGNPFAVGLTLSEFSANSTDSQWLPAFVQGSEEFTYKLAKLGSLAVYWNTDTQSLAGKSREDFVRSFTEMIARNEDQQSHQYILRPVSGTGRITLNKLKTHDRPKTDVSLLFDEIAFAMDQDQYRDALQMIDTFHFFLRHQEYRKYRPRTTVKANPKAWLQFAFHSVRRGIHEKNVVWTWDHMKARRDSRLKYISLFKKKQNETISLAESTELKGLEEDLSYEDIRFYRSLAKNQLRKENALKPKQVAKQAQGWISWAWSGSTAASDQASSEDETVMTEQQRKELYDAIDWDEKQALSDGLEAPEDSVQLNISARLKTGSFSLRKSKFHDAEDLLQLLFNNFGAHFKERPNSMFADMALDAMRIVDGTTPGTLFKEIVKVKEDPTTHDAGRKVLQLDDSAQSDIASTEDPLFFASFESHPSSSLAQSEIVARLKAMEIVYNANCIETLLRFVKPPKSQMESVTALMEVAGEAAKDFKESGRASLEFALSEHKTIAAHLDLQAPLIIIPESCVDANAACIVLDAGKIHIESNLVEQDKIRELQAKNNQQLSDEEMKDLQSLCYDKFQLTLESTQILIGPTVSQALTSLRSIDDRRYHVVDRINMEFLLEISILPKNASLTLTKFRVSGHLPSLSARVSDAKYKTMMRIIDVAIPKDDEGEKDIVAPEDTPHISGGNQSRARAFSSAFSRPPDLVVFPEHEDEEAADDDDEDKFVQAPMDLDEKDLLFRQQIFEFRFTVGELRGSLSKADPRAEDDGQLLVDIILEQFELNFVLRQYDMQAVVVLKSLVVEDRMNVDSPPEFQKLITSEHIGEEEEEQKELVRVKYTQVKSESPEFQSVYGGVEKNVDVALSTINLIVTQKSILTLFDFILTTFTNPEVTQAAEVPEHDLAESSVVSQRVSESSDESKMRVKVELKSIVLVLNQDGIRLATLKMSKGDVGVFLNGQTLRVGAKLGNLSVRDDINLGSEATSSFRQIISIEGDELVDFQYETFDANTALTYPGYDSSVFLRLSSVKINFLEEPLRKILNFGSKFARMKALFDDARAAALSQVQQAQDRAGKMHFDVLIRTPIVIFPRICLETSERDVLIANLGELFAKNSFCALDDREKAPTVNKVNAGIRNIKLSTKFHYVEEAEELNMINDVDAMFDVEMVDSEQPSDIPATRVRGSVSDIKMKVTQSQYKFLMDLSQSIPMIFAGDELDAEELELGNTLSQSTAKEPIKSKVKGPVSDLKAEPDFTANESTGSPAYTTLDADFTVGDLVMEIYSNTEDSPVGDLPKASLSRFSLNSTKAKLCSRSDGSNQGELNIRSFTVEDTRFSKINKFREVIPAITHDGYQFNASVTSSGGPDAALVAMLTIDTPRMIFSLEHLFALQRWGMSAFQENPADSSGDENSDSVADQSLQPKKIEVEEQLRLSTQLAKSKHSKAGIRNSNDSDHAAPTVDDKAGSKSTRSISFRVNVVDPSIILVANSSRADTDAIVLRAKQVLLVQQTVLMLTVDKVGMYMTKMNELDTKRLRVLDDFSLSLSVDSRTGKSVQSIQIIEMDVEPLVLRLSLRDIMLVMQIANVAARLSDDANASPPATGKQSSSGNGRNDSIVSGNVRKRSNYNASRTQKTSGPNQSLATKIKDDRRNSTNQMTAKTSLKSEIVNREELRATFDGLRLVLIGDLHELPMIDMNIDQFTVNIKDWSSEVKIHHSTENIDVNTVDVH